MPDTIFSPPTLRVLRSEVYDALRRAIIAGSFKPGERVNEAEIARQMQISRAPIREAMRLLEQEGLLVSVPRRGTFVVELTRADVEEVYTLRADIESRAIRRALPRFTAEQLDTLASLASQMLTAADAEDLAQLLETDIQFHRQIIETSAWPRLAKIWESLHPQTLTLDTLSTLTDWPPRFHAERHQPVLEAIQSGDCDRAAAAIQEHILRVGIQVIQRLPTASSRPGV